MARPTLARLNRSEILKNFRRDRCKHQLSEELELPWPEQTDHTPKINLHSSPCRLTRAPQHRVSPIIHPVLQTTFLVVLAWFSAQTQSHFVA